MSERGRNLFDQYIVGLLADAEILSSRMEANVEALKAAADASDIRISEIEEEVRGLKNALAKRLSLRTSSTPVETVLEDRVVDLRAGTDASELRILKIEQEVDVLLDARKGS
jgi:hypothetical protein